MDAKTSRRLAFILFVTSMESSSVLAISEGRSQILCGQKLSETLKIVCDGNFNGGSKFQGIRNEIPGIVNRCCKSTSGCSNSELSQYCGSPRLSDEKPSANLPKERDGENESNAKSPDERISEQNEPEVSTTQPQAPFYPITYKPYTGDWFVAEYK